MYVCIYIYIYICVYFGTVQSPERMIDLLEMGFVYPPFDLCVDARAAYDAVAATDVCEPVESSLKCHLIAVRDRMIHGAVGALHWADARDMLTDGLAKGGIDRALRHGVGNDCKYHAIHESLVHAQHMDNQVGVATNGPEQDQ